MIFQKQLSERSLWEYRKWKINRAEAAFQMLTVFALVAFLLSFTLPREKRLKTA